jgi:hypothetical protein
LSPAQRSLRVFDAIEDEAGPDSIAEGLLQVVQQPLWFRSFENDIIAGSNSGYPSLLC